MAITAYLAMTAAEVRNLSPTAEKIAWMACHFSPYSTGISNLPDTLPEGSMLILNDVTPIHGHDPERIEKQLRKNITNNNCMGLLLDFQRKGYPELEDLAKHLSDALPCPVGYFGNHKGPVFLPPVPCHVPIREYIDPWKHREIWLEAALSVQQLQLTPQGCEIHTQTPAEIPDHGHKDTDLHCHYHIALSDAQANFTLWRTKEDVLELLEDAQGLGIQIAVGLWQELQ